MTGGKVVVLGKTGFNFAAGMTGGIAYIYDEHGDFDMRCNLASVDLESIAQNSSDESELKEIIEEHFKLTQSALADELLKNWREVLPKFVKVFPVEYRRALNKASADDTILEKNQQA